MNNDSVACADDAALVLNNVDKRYRNVRALTDVSQTVRKGEFTTVAVLPPFGLRPAASWPSALPVLTSSATACAGLILFTIIFSLIGMRVFRWSNDT